jgi:hypothetical protein
VCDIVQSALWRDHNLFFATEINTDPWEEDNRHLWPALHLGIRSDHYYFWEKKKSFHIHRDSARAFAMAWWPKGGQRLRDRGRNWNKKRTVALVLNHK